MRRALVIAFAIAFAASPAWAASAWVLPAVYNETTMCASGCDYSNLTTWEVATTKNLAGTGEVLTVQAGTYDMRVTISGATGVTSTCFRAIQGEDPTNRPVFNYSGTLTAWTAVGVIQVNVYSLDTGYEQYFGVAYLDITESSTTDGVNAYGIMFSQGSFLVDGNCKAVGNYVHNINGAGVGLGLGIYAMSTNCKIYNNISANCESMNFGVYQGGTAFYNDTSYGGATGFWDQGGASPTAKNCIAEDSTTAEWDGGTWVKTTCTDDGGVVFVNAAGGDFRLDPTDTAALGQGTDLSATFDDDYAGSTRTVPWDIGAWKYTAAAPAGGAWRHVIQLW